MGGRSSFLCLFVIMIRFVLTSAYTDSVDVQALQDLYIALNRPPQLKGWRSDGGDPCEEPWKGISCNGSSVIHIKIADQNLTGFLGFQLSNLVNLKQLDVSYNKIEGEIKYTLPPSITHLDLAFNNFSNNIPYSLSSLKYLRHVNLSHNSLSGSIGNIFTGLSNLREIDFSFNTLTGDLPSSFGSLIRLTKLFLQCNEFTGSVVFLIGLPLTDLNIQDNHFSGILPSQFQSITNLWIGGNRFDNASNYAAWDFAWENIHNESYAYREESVGKKKEVGPDRIGFMIGRGALVAIIVGLVLVLHLRFSRGDKKNRKSSEVSRYSLPVSSTSRDMSPVISAGARSNLRSTPLRSLGVSRRSLKKKNRMPCGVKLYTLAELQLATNFFSNDNLIGNGSLGSDFKAEVPNGKIYAVKKIEMVSLSRREEDQLMDVIRNASRLKHLNIVKLVGYCVERGQLFLVYEYVRNLSLSKALHCESYKPLSWEQRVRVALGIAHALNYLHSTCMPAVAHGGLKATNVLLDEDCMPHVCDCGLAALKSLTSHTVKLKASEMAICDRGYVAPYNIEAIVSGNDDCIKVDIYAFGVLLLELLTGRKPFDSRKPRIEQHLAKYALSRLGDYVLLKEMVDLGIKHTIPCEALCRFAHIVSQCIQPDQKFRPPMSEIVESLVFLEQQNFNVRSFANTGTEVDPPRLFIEFERGSADTGGGTREDPLAKAMRDYRNQQILRRPNPK